MYVSAKHKAMNEAVSRLLNCLHNIKAWMQKSFRQLNCGKTEVILFWTKTVLSQLPNFNLQIEGFTVLPSDQVRNLGVILDSQLTFDAHIKQITSFIFSSQKYCTDLPLPLPTSSRTCHSCLHFQQTGLLECPRSGINRYNHKAFAVCPKLCCLSPHPHLPPWAYHPRSIWSPLAPQRINKFLVLTYQATGTSYLSDLITVTCLTYSPAINLWPLEAKPSAVQHLSCGINFQRQSGKLMSFKTLLKTHLFKLQCICWELCCVYGHHVLIFSTFLLYSASRPWNAPFNTCTYVYYMKHIYSICTKCKKIGAFWLKQHLKNASCS